MLGTEILWTGQRTEFGTGTRSVVAVFASECVSSSAALFCTVLSHGKHLRRVVAPLTFYPVCVSTRSASLVSHTLLYSPPCYLLALCLFLLHWLVFLKCEIHF